MTNSESPVDSFPGEVSVDFRVTVNPVDLPYLVEQLEYLCREDGFGLSFPPGDALPYEHTLPGMEKIDELIGD